SGYLGGVNGIVTNGGPVTLSVNDLGVTGLFGAEKTVRAEPITTIDTSAGGATGGATVAIYPATGTTTGGFSPVNGLPIKGDPIAIELTTSAALVNTEDGVLSLSQDEINTITGTQLVIGRNATAGFESGQISVLNQLFFNPLATPLVNLAAGGDIVDAAGTSGLSHTLGTGVAFRLGLDSLGAIGLVGSGNNTDIFAATVNNQANNIRYIDQDGLTIGTAGDVRGVLAQTFFLETGGDVLQEPGSEIQVLNLSVSAAVSTGVSGINMTSTGGDYLLGPSVTFNGGGAGASGTSVIRGGQVVGVNVQTPGSGYTGAAITFGAALPGSGVAGTSSVGATAVITLDGQNEILVGALSSAAGAAGSSVILNTSSAFQIGSIPAGQPGTTPAALAGITARTISLTAGGDITQAVTAPLNAGIAAGNLASVLMTVPDGSSISLTSPTNVFPSNGRVILGAVTENGARGALSNLTVVSSSGFPLGTVGAAGLTLISAGSSWTLAPVVTITDPAGLGTGAAASALMGVGQLVLASGGTGYATSPIVTITGGGGQGATATASVDTDPYSTTYGQVTGIVLTNPGTGYTALPTVAISGGGGSGAATSTTLSTLVLQGLTLTNPGNGYSLTSLPTVTIAAAPGDTTGSGATATLTSVGTGYGLTGNLSVTAVGAITQPAPVAGSISGTVTVGGNTSLTGTGNAPISLDNPLNNFTGLITISNTGGVNADVTLVNNNNIDLGNVTVAGSLELQSLVGSIVQTQGQPNLRVSVTGASEFYATSDGTLTGTLVGSVILNNTLNTFGGSVSAAGTRVVIRDSDAGGLVLGNIIAPTGLALTSSSPTGGISQLGGTTVGSSANPTGAATFAVANGRNITVGNAGNVFGSTVGFNALSGTLGSITILDTGDLTLPTLSTGGSLTATSTSGTLTLANFTTSAGSATYNGTASLAAATTITTTTGTTFNGTLNGAQNLTLNAGGGAVALNGAVGGTTRLGVITIGSAGNVTASAITAASLLIPAGANAATLTFNGLQNYNTGAGLNAVANIINLNSSVTTTEGGIVSLNADTGALTITSVGDIVSAGVVTLTGAGGISTAGDITTSGAAVIFNNAVAQTGAVTIDTTNSGSSAAGALVTFGGAVTGNQSLTLRVGTGNNITIGAGSNLGTLSVVSANNVNVTDTSGLVLGTSTISGNLTVAAGGAITDSGAVVVAGNTELNAGANAITLDNSGNTFNGTVKVNSNVASLTLVDTTALNLDTISGAALAPGGATSITANGITQSIALNIGTTATFNGGNGAVVLLNPLNTYGGALTVAGGSARIFVNSADQADLKAGAVTTAGLFELTTNPGTGFGFLGGAGGFTLSQVDLAKFSVGIFNPVASGAGAITVGTGLPLDWNVPSIGNVALTTQGTGDIDVANVRFITGNLALVAGGDIVGIEDRVHRVSGLGPIQIGAPAGDFDFQNGQGLNLNGTVSIPGRLTLEVAGQFYNQSGTGAPLAGVQGGSVVKSLSLGGGLPNQISGLAGFSVRRSGLCGLAADDVCSEWDHHCRGGFKRDANGRRAAEHLFHRERQPELDDRGFRQV
ncbi:hypothetical protein EBX31_07105, partial [bacterium]|nr:hypothetical protein [bacterium]